MFENKTVQKMLVAVLLAGIVFGAIPNAAAYSIGQKPSSGASCSGYKSGIQVIQICGYSYSEAYQMFLFPQYAADAVWRIAQQNGVPMQRTRSSIETEIKAHALLRISPNILVYRSGKWRWTWEIADPMDIETNKVEDWVALLD